MFSLPSFLKNISRMRRWWRVTAKSNNQKQLFK